MARIFTRASSEYARSTVLPITAYPFTLFAWVKCNTFTGTETVFGLFGNSSSANFNTIAIASGGNAQAVRFGTTGQTAQTAASFSTATWVSICGVFRGAADHSVYLSGGNRTNNTTSTTTPTTPTKMTAGIRDSNTQANAFDGKIAMLAAWSDDILDGGVAALDKGANPMDILPSALKFYAPYCGVGSVVQDMYGNHLTPSGTTTDADAPAVLAEPFG